MMQSSPSEDMSRCTVERKCSSTGKACGVDDRDCQNDAVAHGLEITCERTDRLTAARSYVYCPPGGEQRDSKVVWILLAVAVMIAIGGALSFLALRRRLRR